MVITLSRPRVAGLVASLVFVCLAEFSVGPSSNRKQLVRPALDITGRKCADNRDTDTQCVTREKY